MMVKAQLPASTPPVTRELTSVLESLGYTVQVGPAVPDREGPYTVVGQCPGTFPIAVCIYSASVDVSASWPCTEEGKQHQGIFIVMVNQLNCYCRMLTCQALTAEMEIRACFPFAFEADRFRSFMEIWLDDAAEIIQAVKQENLGYLDFDTETVQ